ncbi:unnamed protein product [Rotaria sordida]|uniref:Uncharacterized protein n=1 Tax=Rotaria sordida TaxID=392033 RepID=A0A815NEN3_9BILA|nr:unnamed protein product [Rotaria sordida]CAF1436437.1 unnamed protein product [Rotaria sordida]CAF3992498.1 unnamed protein product [Rotaria sordida]
MVPRFDKAFEEAVKDPSPADFGARCSEKQQLLKSNLRTVVFYVKDFAYETSQILYKVLLNHVSSLLQTIDVYQIIQIQTINNTKSYSIVIG